MPVCDGCGAVAPADPDTGYCADNLCPRCVADEQVALDTERDTEDEQYEQWRDSYKQQS